MNSCNPRITMSAIGHDWVTNEWFVSKTGFVGNAFGGDGGQLKLKFIKCGGEDCVLIWLLCICPREYINNSLITNNADQLRCKPIRLIWSYTHLIRFISTTRPFNCAWIWWLLCMHESTWIFTWDAIFKCWMSAGGKLYAVKTEIAQG